MLLKTDWCCFTKSTISRTILFFTWIKS